jgi:L-lactate dehydrogenase
LPEKQIIGSGTILDTARLRARLSEYYHINQQNVHAYIMGEHGDSAFVPWSIANISNVPVDDYPNYLSNNDGMIPPLNHDDIENYVRKSGARVIARKGATFYAVSVSVCHICKALLGAIDTTMTVSTMMHGEYGIDDVCLSVLNIVGREGAEGKVIMPLTDGEVALLNKSAESLKEVIRSLDI